MSEIKLPLEKSARKFKWLESSAVLWAVFAVMVLADIVVRWSFFKARPANQWLIYFGSVVFEAILLGCLWRFWLKYKTTRFASFLVVGVIYTFSVLGGWGFYLYFHTLPGMFAFTYFFEEPGDFVSLMTGGSAWLQLIGVFVVGFVWALLARWLVVEALGRNKNASIQSESHASFGQRSPAQVAQSIGFALFIVTIALVLNRHVTLSPGAALPATDAAVSFKNAAWRQISGKSSWVRLQQRIPGAMPAPLPIAAQFNLVVIVNESLRKHNLSTYGYQRDTFSGFDQFTRGVEAEGGVVAKFERALSNATQTCVSIPSVLTGVSPVSGYDQMQRSFVVYEQLKRVGGLKTALISAHSYATGNYRAFVESPALDYLWYREIDDLPAYNNVGADDKFVPEKFGQFLANVKAGEHFAAVLHFNGTHYPYQVPDALKVYSGQPRLDDYDNSIKYLDKNIGFVLESLRSRGELEKTVVFFTSDHGESLGEGDANGHLGRVTGYNVNIPMVLVIPKGLKDTILPGGTKAVLENTSRFVSNIDIFPTLLDLFSIPYKPEQYPGMSLVRPISDDRVVFVYNMVNSDVMTTFLGIFRGDLGVVATRLSGNGASEAKGGNTDAMAENIYAFSFLKDPEARNNIWGTVEPGVRSTIQSAVEKFPQLSDFKSCF